jgi:hypothetical protein
MLEQHLNDELTKAIIGRFYNAPAAEPRDRKEMIEEALCSHKATREEQTIESLSDYQPGKNLVSGLRSVIDSSNLFLVRKIVADETLEAGGYVCKQHHFLALTEGNCPFCGNRLRQIENVTNEILEISRLHGVQLTLIKYRPELLRKYDRIAAVVYEAVTVS